MVGHRCKNQAKPWKHIYGLCSHQVLIVPLAQASYMAKPNIHKVRKYIPVHVCALQGHMEDQGCEESRTAIPSTTAQLYPMVKPRLQTVKLFV